jgi:hypothetical protein
MNTKSMLCAASLLLAAFGCGSYADDPGAPTTIASIRGQVKNLESAPVPSNFRVALVWMGNPYNVASELSMVPKFPASFQLDVHHLPPKSALQTDDELLPGLKLAVGAVVGYEDLNGNGKLDMVDSDAAEFVDDVVAANESFVVLYTEGSAAAYAALPVEFSALEPGFNLLEVRFDDGAFEIQIHPITAMYDLFLSADARINEMMCTISPGSSGGGSTQLHEGQPPAYPDPQDPDLICDPNGASYVLTECTTISQGPCKGTETSCTAHYWYRPNPVPADWPCP